MASRAVSAVFVEPGLGKTPSTLAALETLIADTGKGVLVVAPKKVANLVWPEEVQKWKQFRWMRVAMLRTRDGQLAWETDGADIYIINWESVPWFEKTYLNPLGKRDTIPPGTVVYDEISKIKGNKSVWRKLLVKYRHHFSYHIGLTGSPRPNSYLDLWSQFRLLDGGDALGRSFSAYRNEHFKQTDWHGYKYEIRPGHAERIQKLIAPMVIVKQRKDHLHIPPVHYIDIEVPLGKELQAQYDKLEKDLVLQMTPDIITAVNSAALVGKLSQFTGGTIYLDPEPGETVRKWRRVHDLKMDALAKLVTKEPLLVSTMFRHERARYMKRFPKMVQFEDHLAGPWNARKVPLMTADPRSMGHGLNLQGGNRLAWASLTYSREIYDQMNDRLARRGQTRETYIYRLICPNTVDEIMAMVLEEKGQGQQGLFSAINKLKRQYT